MAADRARGAGVAVPLYHFSEEPGIASFEPRRAPSSSLEEELVWAIDDWHQCMYFFPRDCPRACFWPSDQTTPEDRERWFGGIDARMIVAIESQWFERVRGTTIYRYELPEAAFVLKDNDGSGHWISRERVVPLSIEPMPDLLSAIIDAGVELRITPSLIDLWQRVIASTLSFSGTRLRNAQGYERIAHLG